jgi:hypothetical protein
VVNCIARLTAKTHLGADAHFIASAFTAQRVLDAKSGFENSGVFGDNQTMGCCIKGRGAVPAFGDAENTYRILCILIASVGVVKNDIKAYILGLHE